MSRLIDADALLKRKGCVYDSEGHVTLTTTTDATIDANTIKNGTIDVDYGVENNA